MQANPAMDFVPPPARAVTRAKSSTVSRRVVAGVKSSVGVSPKIELHDPFSLPRMTSGQGKTACHRVDDRRKS